MFVCWKQLLRQQILEYTFHHSVPIATVIVVMFLFWLSCWQLNASRLRVLLSPHYPHIHGSLLFVLSLVAVARLDIIPSELASTPLRSYNIIFFSLVDAECGSNLRHRPGHRIPYKIAWASSEDAGWSESSLSFWTLWLFGYPQTALLRLW